MERNKLARQIIDTCLEMTRLGLNQGCLLYTSVKTLFIWFVMTARQNWVK